MNRMDARLHMTTRQRPSPSVNRKALALLVAGLAVVASCGADSDQISRDGPLGPIDDPASMCMATDSYSTFTIGSAYFLNDTRTPIRFASVALRNADGVDLGSVVVVPVVPPAPLVGVMGDYPPSFKDEELSRRWSNRKDAVGFRLEPGAAVNIVLQVSFTKKDASADGFSLLYRQGDSGYVFDNRTRVESGAACGRSS